MPVRVSTCSTSTSANARPWTDRSSSNKTGPGIVPDPTFSGPRWHAIQVCAHQVEGHVRRMVDQVTGRQGHEDETPGARSPFDKHAVDEDLLSVRRELRPTMGHESFLPVRSRFNPEP